MPGVLPQGRGEANWHAAYLAVNSSKVSSWASDRIRLEVLKVLTEPLVAIKAGMAKTALELRGVMLRMPLARKKVLGCARAAIRSNEVDDIRRWWW